MKKAIKVIGVAALAGTGIYAYSYYRQFKKFKKMEDRMESLPLHKLHVAVTERHPDPNTLIVEMPKSAGFWNKLVACLHILTA